MFRSTLTFFTLTLTLTLLCSSAFGQVTNLPISEVILQELGNEEAASSLSQAPAIVDHKMHIQDAVRTDLIPGAVECLPLESRLDINNDGRTDGLIRREYDLNGLLREEHFRFENALEGEPNRIRMTSYNEDGFAVMRITRTAPVQHGFSHRFNISIEDIETMQRDAAGSLLEHSIDLGNDGQRDEVRTFEYDRRGHETIENIDEDADGIVDLIRTTQLSPSEGIIRITLQIAEQRTPISTMLIQLDDEDRPVLIERDVDGDGQMDTLQKNTFDGPLMIGTWSQDERGEETLTVFGYDAMGNQTLMAMDFGNDGTMEEVLTTTFTCP
jgi:hypothetical protein